MYGTPASTVGVSVSASSPVLVSVASSRLTSPLDHAAFRPADEHPAILGELLVDRVAAPS